MDVRLFWLALGTFAIGAEGFVATSLLPAIGADTGVTVAQGGYLVLVFSLAYAVGAPVLAALAGHRDRRATLAIGLLIFALANIGAGLAQSFGELLVARAAMALGAGLYVATAQATAVSITPESHRARAISVIVGGLTVAVAVGAPLGALVAQFVGWRGTFWTVAVIALAATLAIWRMIPSGLRGTKLSLGQRLAVVARPGMPLALLSNFLLLCGSFAVFTYIVPLATEAMGESDRLMPLVLLVLGLGSAAGNYIGGQLADRFGAGLTAAWTALLTTLMLVLLSVVPHLPASTVGIVFLVLLLPWGVAGWMFPPAQAGRIVRLVPDAVAIALSFNSSALYLGSALGALVGGQVIMRGTPADLGWVGAFFAIAAFLTIILHRPAPALAGASQG